MNNLFFWIIVCSWVIPVGIRWYNRSRLRRSRDLEFGGRGYPGQDYPGQNYPGQGYHGHGYPGPYSESPPIIPLPGDPHAPGQNTPGQNTPGQNWHPQNQPGQIWHPQNEREAGQEPPSTTGSPPAPAGTGAARTGFRARKLAELDAEYSSGAIAMEEYMKRRQEIMDG